MQLFTKDSNQFRLQKRTPIHVEPPLYVQLISIAIMPENDSFLEVSSPLPTPQEMRMIISLLDRNIIIAVQTSIRWTNRWFYITKFIWQKIVLLTIGLTVVSGLAIEVSQKNHSNVAKVSITILASLILMILLIAYRQAVATETQFQESDTFKQPHVTSYESRFRVLMSLFLVLFASTLGSPIIAMIVALYIVGEYVYACVP